MSEALTDSSGVRPLRWTGVALAALALTLCFMVLRFPYDRLAERVAFNLEQEHGVRVAFGEVGLTLVGFGPGIAAESVRVVLADDRRFDFERIAARPALALAWLKGDPALFVDADSVQGSARGVLTLGDSRHYDGTLQDFDLALVPMPGLGPALRVEGRADAEIDLGLGEEGPLGAVDFEARDGRLTQSGLPIPLPFQRLAGELVFHEDRRLEIPRLDLESPLANGKGSGSIGPGRVLMNAPLRLELEIQVSGVIRRSLTTQGVEVGRDGKIALDVAGTLLRPRLR